MTSNISKESISKILDKLELENVRTGYKTDSSPSIIKISPSSKDKVARALQDYVNSELIKELDDILELSEIGYSKSQILVAIKDRLKKLNATKDNGTSDE